MHNPFFLVVELMAVFTVAVLAAVALLRGDSPRPRPEAPLAVRVGFGVLVVAALVGGPWIAATESIRVGEIVTLSGPLAAWLGRGGFALARARHART